MVVITLAGLFLLAATQTAAAQEEGWQFEVAPYMWAAGTGDSDLIWQAIGGLAYKFKKSDVLLGYRYLEWDFDNNDVFDDMNISGPYAGLKIRF